MYSLMALAGYPVRGDLLGSHVQQDRILTSKTACSVEASALKVYVTWQPEARFCEVLRPNAGPDSTDQS